MSVVLYEARQGCHQGPKSKRGGDDVASIATIGKPGDGYAGGDVYQGKTETRQESQLSIAEPQLRFNWLLQNDEDLTINEVKGVNQGEHDQDGPAVARARDACLLWRHLLVMPNGVAVHHASLCRLPHRSVSIGPCLRTQIA